jgi:hypothetical protein
MASLQVLNPVAQSAARKYRPAQRVPDLRGKTIGLCDNSRPKGEVATQRLLRQLGAKFEGAQLRCYTGSMPSTLNEQGAKAIADECDVVIGVRGD